MPPLFVQETMAPWLPGFGSSGNIEGETYERCISSYICEEVSGLVDLRGKPQFSKAGGYR
jgi:hypothetical protein